MSASTWPGVPGHPLPVAGDPANDFDGVSLRQPRRLRWECVTFCLPQSQTAWPRFDATPLPLPAKQVKYLVASGRLSPGEELPPIRALAERLLVNPNTVARAYRELQTACVVTKRRTAGTYVSDAGSPLEREVRLEILTGRVDTLLAEARQMDVTTDEIVELIHQRDSVMKPRGQGGSQS